MYHYHDDRFSFENLDLVGMAQAENFLLFSSQVVGHIFCFKKTSGGWTNPSEKYARQIWKPSPNRGEHKKYFKPPPSDASFSDQIFFREKTFEKKTPNNIPALRIMGGLEIPEPCYTGPSPSVGGFMDSCQCKGLVSPLTQIKLLWHGQTLNEETFRHVFFQVS